MDINFVLLLKSQTKFTSSQVIFYGYQYLQKLGYYA